MLQYLTGKLSYKKLTCVEKQYIDNIKKFNMMYDLNHKTFQVF
jgi:hypothetical protein